MRKFILLAGAAALAAAMPVLAQGHGGGHGKGGGGGGGPPQAVPHGNGGGHGGGNPHAAHGPQVARGGGNKHAARPDRGPGQVRHAEHRQEQAVRRAERSDNGNLRRNEQRDVREARRGGERDWTGWTNRGRGTARDLGRVDRLAFWREGRPLPVSVGRGGCPPGLAKQNAFCMPPGQLRHALSVGSRIDANRFGAVPEDWRYRFTDNDEHYYRYDQSGTIYRVDRSNDLVSSIIPLFGELGIGQALPLGYDAYNLPVPYRDVFADNDDWMYRYDDNAIYRVNSRTRMIDGIAALLTGNPINVGSPLPAGYDAYNVPLDYRDRYVDDADSLYRYSNGGIYQVDPTTQLVQALVEMIV